MKLSAKKKSQIYGLVHSVIVDLRIDLRNNYLPTLNKDKIDYVIAQVERPLAQKIMCLLDKDYEKELDIH